MDLELAGNEMLAKFAAFLVVQTLVYLILSQSSGVFSGAVGRRSASFLRRTESARRMAMAALLSEMVQLPGGGEPSSPAGGQRGTRPIADGGGDMDAELELLLTRCSFS